MAAENNAGSAQSIVDAFRAFSENTRQFLNEAGKMAGAALGSLLSVIGLGSIGEAVQDASARGAGDKSSGIMEGSAPVVAPATPAQAVSPEVGAPAAKQTILVLKPEYFQEMKSMAANDSLLYQYANASGANLGEMTPPLANLGVQRAQGTGIGGP
jgi:hypothetical protein